MHTGKVIKYLRNQNNMTQEQLAQILGVKKSSIQKYENGKIQNLKQVMLQNLCKTFHTSPYAFVFPDAWAKLHTRNKSGSMMDPKTMITFFNLSDEGRKKVLDYINDISEIRRYQHSDQATIDLQRLINK